jgi:hypothetical protein
MPTLNGPSGLTISQDGSGVITRVVIATSKAQPLFFGIPEFDLLLGLLREGRSGAIRDIYLDVEARAIALRRIPLVLTQAQLDFLVDLAKDKSRRDPLLLPLEALPPTSGPKGAAMDTVQLNEENGYL